MEEEKEKEGPRDFSFFHVLVKYFLRQLARFGSDITTAGNSGAEKEMTVRRRRRRRRKVEEKETDNPRRCGEEAREERTSEIRE